eukprot:TRINITY_DN18539_c0_g1_i1.p1 TRINITY_DN18539_c0_g1~~TRINITY_DN18539_c0_g1_i1.p1  ORF type:complete len:376 (-),score=88.82 TRINITY_DN18539_c0_g1_i1:144-1271(-)
MGTTLLGKEDILLATQKGVTAGGPGEAYRVAWQGGGSAAAVAHLRSRGVLVEDVPDENGIPEPADATPRAAPAAGLDRLVVTPRSFGLLSERLRGEREAASALASLVTHVAAFRAAETCASDEAPDAAALPPPRRKVLLVGVSGPSCSGKSTVAKELARLVRSPVASVHADNYFDTALMQSSPAPFEALLDYEQPSGIAWPILLQDLRRMASTLARAERVPEELRLSCSAWFSLAPDAVAPDMRGAALGPEPVVIVVEGFLLYACKELSDLCSLRFFLDVEQEECLRRRWSRDGANHPSRWFDEVPEQLPSEPSEKFRAWFDGIVWSAYEKNLALQRENGCPWISIDASLDTSVIFPQCKEAMETMGDDGPNLAT